VRYGPPKFCTVFSEKNVDFGVTRSSTYKGLRRSVCETV
jgi:hypothetical protein